MRPKRQLRDARLGPKPTLAPYGLGDATTTCAPLQKGKAVRVCITRPERVGRALTGPADVCQLLRGAVNADRESFYALHLDAGNRVLGIEHVAKGGADWVETTPRETFKAAIVGNASAIILAHNHPSGRAEPSEADVQLTERMIQVGQLMGIPVRDHVIVAADGCTSLRETTMRSAGFGGAWKKRRR